MDVVIVANAWSAAADNPTSKHQIARTLAAGGHRVLWLEGAGMRAPSIGSGSDRGRMVRKVRASLRGAVRIEGEGQSGGGLWVLAPLLVPLPRYAPVRVVNGWWFRTAARWWARRLGFRDPVLINYVPVLAYAMRGWSPTRARTVYHCVDRWDRFAMYDAALMEEMDRRCRAYAGLVIASSHDLYEHCRRDHDRVVRIDHGVNFAHFRSALDAAPARPADLPGGALIGFIGLLSEWVDQELLVAIARSCRDARLVLIGKSDVAVDRLASEPNVHIMGPRPFARLPAYMAHFNVGLIPFHESELTRAVNPIKLREMLAAGCPVVATNLPEVARYAGDGVAVCTSRNDFVARVGACVASPPAPAARRALSDRMRGEDWNAKTAEIIMAIEETGRLTMNMDH